MKKFSYIIALLTILFCFGCKSLNEQQELTYGVSATSARTYGPDTLLTVQMDSVVKHDKLPVIAKWVRSEYKDYESNKIVVCRTLYDQTSSTVYTVKELGNGVFVMSKRVLRVR